MSWIPPPEMINSLLTSWKTRKILGVLRQNRSSISRKSFEAGLNRLLLAACREKDTAVLQELLPLSLRHFWEIDHLYMYKVQTEKKHLELIADFHPFIPNLSWMTAPPYGWPHGNSFVPSVELQGTLLHIAAEAGSLKAVQLLLSHDANIDIVNCCGRTPLMTGIHNVEVANFFISNGCNVNHQDEWGQTPLMLLVWKASACKYLLKPLLHAGADPKIIDHYGKTMVHHACELIIDGDVIPLLIEHNILTETECNDKGMISYAGIPLVISHGFSHIYKKKQSFSHAFLSHVKFCELLSIRNVDDYEKQLPLVHKFIRELGMSYEGLPPDPVYGNRKEITSAEEFNRLVSSSSERFVEHLYQLLIISERLIGSNTQENICLLGELISFQRSLDNKAALICRFLDRVSRYYEQYHCNSSIVKYFQDALSFSTLTDVGFVGQQIIHKEFLSSFAKAIGLLCQKARNVHLHRYHHTEECDIGTVLYGTSYAKFPTSTVAPYAAKVIAFFVYEAIKNSTQLDKSLLQVMVQSCEVHPHSPVYAKSQILIQQSSILYELIQSFDGIDYHMLEACKAIVEVNAVDMINSPIPDHQTLMHLAVKHDSVELVEFLLNNGAHPDAVDGYGNSPLMDVVESAESSTIRSKLIPDKLSCIVCKAILAGGIPYDQIELPENIKKLINLHDKNRFGHKQII